MNQDLNINVLNLLIMFGVVHGLMMIFVLIFSIKNTRSGNALLALLLIFYTLPVLRIVLFDMNVLRPSELSWFSAELIYGLGPSLYLYAKTIADREFVLQKIHLLHFLPVLLELVYYASPLYQQNRVFVLTTPRDVYHLIWMTQQIGAMVSIFVYLYLTNTLLRDYSKWVQNNFSDIHNRALSWLQKPVFLYSVFFTCWFGLRGIDVFYFHDQLDIKVYYPLLLFLSFSTYWIATKGYLNTQLRGTGFHIERERGHHDSFDDKQLGHVFASLEAQMGSTKLYLEPDLSLPHLAKLLGVNQRLLSKAINTQAKANFHDYINRYRIEEFKRRISQVGSNRHILNIALDCGFGSKATFNHVFRKSTGMTPSQYRKDHAPIR